MPETRSFVDLHTHSDASFDSLSSPTAMVDRARRLGFTHLAITDHERIDGALRAVEAADGPGGALQVIVGEEIRSRDGDVLGLFLERAVPPGLSAADTSAAIREQGGLVGLPHPFDGLRSSGGQKAGTRLGELAAVVDFVEVHNARAYRDANPRAAAFAREHGVPGVASSDAHTLTEMGVTTTILPGPFHTADELKALLPEATLVTGRASFYVRAWTPIAKIVQRSRGNGRVRPDAAPPRAGRS
jgi:predicted metal-dependent phosphoesterase TrpH